MIGPPRPPAASDSDEDLFDGEPENRHRIPLSNEIVLKGHTKVLLLTYYYSHSFELELVRLNVFNPLSGFMYLLLNLVGIRS